LIIPKGRVRKVIRLLERWPLYISPDEASVIFSLTFNYLYK